MNEINYKSYGEYLDQDKVMASGEYGRTRNGADCISTLMS